MFTKDVLLTTLKAVKRADKTKFETAEAEAQIINALIPLPYIEKNIIYSFYMRGDKWLQISDLSNYSATQCKNIRNRALDALLYQLNNARFFYGAGNCD